MTTSRRRWTAAEDEVLRSLPTMSPIVLAQALDRSVAAIHHRRQYFKGTTVNARTGSGRSHWTIDEDDYLRAHPEQSIPTLADALGRSLASVSARRLRLNLVRKRNCWTREETAWLLAHSDLTAQQAADHLGRTCGQVRGKRSVLRREPASRPWTPEEDEYLRSHVETDRRTVAAALNRTVAAISMRRVKLGAQQRR